MYYLHHVHTASASAQSVYLPRFLPSGPCLCIVKHSSLSFVSLGSGSDDKVHDTSTPTASALTELLSVPINGRILRVVRVPSSDALASNSASMPDCVAVLTDHHQPRLFILRYRAPPSYVLDTDGGDSGTFPSHASSTWTAAQTEATLLLEELGRPAAESGLTLDIEEGPGAAYMLSHTHAGILKVVPLHGNASSSGPSGSPSMDRDVGSVNTGGIPDLAHAFGVRLPHPHLISSTFIARQRTPTSQASVLALLSLSSTASRLPGLGMQCLPVLSFHTIDEANQELQPLAWGPPRKIPTQLKSPLLEAADGAPSGSSGGGGASESGSRRRSSQSRRSLPGTYEEIGSEDKASVSQSTRKSATGRHGPAAVGASRTLEEEIAYEEALAKAPMTRAHVPLPFLDALGAHYLLALPARAGGGVLVFSETSILLVPPPPLPTTADVKSPTSPSKANTSSSSSVVPDKRRKSSTGNTPTSPRRTASGKADLATTTSALSVSPTSTFTLPSQANENGKRRRSTAGSMSATTVGAPRRRSSAAASAAQRILRVDMPSPMIVASACVVKEQVAENGDDDGVRLAPNTAAGAATVGVLFSTHSGRLELLTVTLEPQKPGNADTPLQGPDQQMYTPVALDSSILGHTSAPAGPGALTYLGESYIHVASASGDSVIVRLAASPTSKDPQTVLDEIHRWPVLAPILDFVVDDGAGGDPIGARSAQARIITCSGSGPTGSLRIVRNGVGLHDLATLEEHNVRRVWAIEAVTQQASPDVGTSLLVLGYLQHARVLALGASGFEEQTDVFSALGWDANVPVLAACNVRDCGFFVLVNSNGVHAMNIDGSAAPILWQPIGLVQQIPSLAQEQITLAAVNEAGQALLAFKTGHLILLQIGSDGIHVVTVHQLESEPSALDISPSPNTAAGAAANLVSVALWKPALVKLFTLPDLRDATPMPLLTPQPTMVRSVMLHTFSYDDITKPPVPYLLVGLGDGALISYGISLPSSTSISQSIGVVERRNASLGSQPLHLRSFFTKNGARAVLAASDRSSIVSSQGFGLTYSSVRYRDVRDMCLLNFPSGAGNSNGEVDRLMLFVMPDQLRIARMGEISRLDVSSVDLGYDNPVSLALCPEQRAIGVVTTRFLPEGRGTAPVQGGKVILRDCEHFDALDEFTLEMEERPNCIDAFSRLGLSYLVVGTGYTLPDRTETTSGRVLVFRITSGAARLLQLVSSRNVDGNVFDVKAIAPAAGSDVDRIVACVNAKVISLQLEDDDATMTNSGPSSKAAVPADDAPSTLLMMQTGEWGCAFTATTLSFSAPNRLIVGDALRSIVILALDNETGALSEMARDCDPYWTVACELLDAEDEVYIGSDIAFNLWTCRRLKWSQSAKDRLEQSRLRESETGHRATGAGAVSMIDHTWSHIMQRDAAFHYGDLVNKIKRAALTTSPSASASAPGQRVPFDPRLMFVTAAGAIGVIAKLDERASRILAQLETKLRDAWAPIGQIDAEDYRTLRTDHRVQASAGFIDGDSIQRRFEPLSHETRARLLRRGRLPLDADVDEVNSLVEALNRLS